MHDFAHSSSIVIKQSGNKLKENPCRCSKIRFVEYVNDVNRMLWYSPSQDLNLTQQLWQIVEDSVPRSLHDIFVF